MVEDIIGRLANLDCSYVDSYRSFATKLGGGTEDLKDSILMSGLKLKSGELLMPGEPNDQMYLKQAEYLIRIGRSEVKLSSRFIRDFFCQEFLVMKIFTFFKLCLTSC